MPNSIEPAPVPAGLLKENPEDIQEQAEESQAWAARSMPGCPQQFRIASPQRWIDLCARAFAVGLVPGRQRKYEGPPAQTGKLVPQECNQCRRRSVSDTSIGYRRTLPLGAAVIVKEGVIDPDYPDTPLSGWTGRIKAVFRAGGPTSYLVEWDQHTLDSKHRQRCEQDGLQFDSLWLGEDEVEEIRESVPPEWRASSPP
jgi:hypothetical protein